MSFEAFDPLKAKQTQENEAAINALKKELRNILDSYFGWYDPFCELIQNALDSLDEKLSNDKSYQPSIRIIIDLKDNYLIVSDNGMGLSKEKYEQFLAPSFSFKSGNTRGHKGVGATYLAYGFNYIQISTKTPDFQVTGKMLDARKWLNDPNPPGNPKVQPDSTDPMDKEFNSFNTGVSICIKFDSTTYPSTLSWLRATKAAQWFQILSIKTGLGAFFNNDNINVTIITIDEKGEKTQIENTGISYFWPHQIVRKKESLRNLRKKQDDLFNKKGAGFKMPAAMTNLDAIYDTVQGPELNKYVSLSEEENDIINKFDPSLYFCFMYSAKVWSTFNDDLDIRQGTIVLSPGIQIAANNMPQGEILEIPLKRNTGRQHQMKVLFHFKNCNADVGRKGFKKEIVDYCKSISRKLIEDPIQKMRSTLRPVTGVKGDLKREADIDSWKDEMVDHEKKHPLKLMNDHFFIPMKCVSITSIPTREQDVIALFNQLIAGGIIRGIRIMATNERFAYDGMYRVIFEKPSENFVYDRTKNPLGVLKEYVDGFEDGILTKPKILEYKFSLDALIEDIESGDKNSNDIGLVIVWETGEDYQGNYHITSLLDEDNLSDRQYHGVTHVMTNITSGQKEMDLIVLQELITHLNDIEASIEFQKQKYEENY